jgi:hypothetical protein
VESSLHSFIEVLSLHSADGGDVHWKGWGIGFAAADKRFADVCWAVDTAIAADLQPAATLGSLSITWQLPSYLLDMFCCFAYLQRNAIFCCCPFHAVEG